MPLSLLEYAALHGWLAALIGLLCGWSATLSGGWVARWSWLLGLREEPPDGLGRQLLPGVGAAMLSLMVTWLPFIPALVAGLLGLIWGYAAMDLGNNVRAALVLRELAGAPDAVAAWQALPASLRFGQAAANSAGAAVVILAVGVLARDPSLLGFVAGAGAYLLRQRLAVAEVLASQAPEPPQQPPAEA